jgi:uncharacterized protein YukE
MAGLIRVTPDALERVVYEIDLIVNESKQINNRTQNILGEIDSSWIGDEIKAYVDKIMFSNHAEEERILNLQALSDYIRRIIEAYSVTESSLEDSVKELFKT